MASSTLRALWNSPTGPKTTHFWGPVANWGFVLAVRRARRCERRARADARDDEMRVHLAVTRDAARWRAVDARECS